MAREEDDLPQIEFSLEETYENLLDEKRECLLHMERLCEHLRNNGIRPIGRGPDVTEHILKERIKYASCLAEVMKKKQPNDLPIPGSEELVPEVMKHLEQKVKLTTKLNNQLMKDIEEEKKRIHQLDMKKANFKKLEEMYIASLESVDTENYVEEVKMVRSYFEDTKQDLANLMEKLFPDNDEFKDFFMELCKNYFSGGDDVYVDVLDECAGMIDFLDEAALLNYHPHDKTKVKLANLL